MIWMDVDAALSEVPVNSVPLTDDTDFKTIETAVAYNATGLTLYWHFVTSAGAYSATAVTPTTAGNYDWAHQQQGMYTIEIPASGGASINNDTEGYGWFTGVATGVLPWRGPTIGFRASGLNDLLCDSAYSATRGLAGTALPNAAADAAGGLPISDAGGLDLDTVASNVAAVLADTGTDGVVVAAGSKTGYTLTATTGLGNQTADITGNLSGSVGSVTGAVGSVTGNVGGNVTGSVGSVAAGGITAASIATDAIDADALAADAVAEINATVDTALADYDGPTYTELLNLVRLALRKDAGLATDLSALLTTLNADLGSGAGAYASTTDSQEAIRDVTALETTAQSILTDTAEIGAAGAGLTEAGGTGDHLTAIPWNASWDAEVQSEVQDALEANHLDHLLAATYDPASKPGAADALLNELVENDGGVSRFTANALEQAPSGGTNPNILLDTTVASINSQTSIVLTAGADFDDAYQDQTIVLYDASNSDYPSVRVVSSYTGATKTVVLDSAPDFTLAASGDGVKIFATAPGTSAPTAAQVADAVWDEATSGHTTAGTFGEQLKTDVDAILADTNELQTDWADGGRLDLIVDAVLVDTAEIGVAGAGLTNINLPDQTMNITGNITGNLSGSVGSVTAGVTLADGAHGGNSASFVFGGGGTISNGAGTALTITATGATAAVDIQGTDCGGIRVRGNGGAVLFQGNTSGYGLSILGSDAVEGLIVTGGATGHAAHFTGGATSGNGIHVTTTSGDAVSLTATGTSKHGLVATGGNGGTSDGIKATAGTGGVDIRGALTGNVTGNLSGSVGSVATGGIAASSFAAGAVDAAALAADAVTEIQSGLATAAALATAQADLDTLTGADGVTLATSQPNYAPLKPTSAGRTLDVTLGGCAGIDWANVESPTTTLALTGTTVSTSQVVASVTGNVTGSVGSLAAQAKADVNAELVDVMATDTHAEQGQGSPAATTTYAVMIGCLYKAWRNKKTQTSALYQLYADDGTTVDQKATVSDDGTTTTVGEVTTGP